MSTIYSVSIKKIKKSKSADQVASILETHLEQVKEHSQKMLDIEIANPMLFEDYKSKPPPESKRLRKLAEDFSTDLAKLSAKYGQHKAFLKASGRVITYRYDEEKTASKVGTNFLRQKRQELETILTDLKNYLNIDQLRQSLNLAIQTLKAQEIKSESFRQKYPDLLEKQLKALKISKTLNDLNGQILKVTKRIALKYRADEDIVQKCSQLKELLAK